MKKALFTGFFGIAFAFAMVSCNGNAANTDSAVDSTATVAPAQTEQCEHHCQNTCQDSACLANNCENCACPDSSACKQKACCKGEGQECHKAEGCQNDGACKKGGECKKGEGECCKK